MEYDAFEFADTCANLIERCANARHNVLVDEWNEAVDGSGRTGKWPDKIGDFDPIRTQEGLNAYAETRNLIAGCLEDAKAEASEAYRASVGAPSEEALRYIQMLGMKDKVDEGDVKDAVNRYGDQLDCFNAIKSMAKRSDVPFYYRHPLEQGGKIIDAIAGTTSKYIEMLNGGMSEARLEAAKTELREMAANQDALGRPMFD